MLSPGNLGRSLPVVGRRGGLRKYNHWVRASSVNQLPLFQVIAALRVGVSTRRLCQRFKVAPAPAVTYPGPTSNGAAHTTLTAPVVADPHVEWLESNGFLTRLTPAGSMHVPLNHGFASRSRCHERDSLLANSALSALARRSWPASEQAKAAAQAGVPKAPT